MRDMRLVVIGIITIVVAFILFPMVLTAGDAIGSANLTNLTGMSEIYVVGPTILFIGMLFSGGMLTYFGFRGK